MAYARMENVNVFILTLVLFVTFWSVPISAQDTELAKKTDANVKKAGKE